MAKNEILSMQLKQLHDKRTTFVIPNAWDVGSAKLLAALGFPAIASTGAGAAYSMGYPNSDLGRATILQNAREIAAQIHVPLSADLENGFGDTPQDVAKTIKLAIDAGLAGGSIEDASPTFSDPIYNIDLAAERIRAAAEEIRRNESAFQLVARAENYLFGRADLKDTILRLQRYQEAGANVLYAPGLTTIDEIEAVVSSVDLPVNVVMGRMGDSLSLDVLRRLGVARVSVGSSLQRYAYGALERAAQEISQKGTFEFSKDALRVEDLDARFTALSA